MNPLVRRHEARNYKKCSVWNSKLRSPTNARVLFMSCQHIMYGKSKVTPLFLALFYLPITSTMRTYKRAEIFPGFFGEGFWLSVLRGGRLWENPMKVEAQDLLCLSPLSWDQEWVCMETVSPSTNTLGMVRNGRRQAGVCGGGKSGELEIEGSKFKILEGQAKHKG